MGAAACRDCRSDASEVVDAADGATLSGEPTLGVKGVSSDLPVEGKMADVGVAPASGGRGVEPAEAGKAVDALDGAAAAAPAVPEAAPVAAPDAQGYYNVVLVKEVGSKLGIDVDAFEENTTLPIMCVTGGLVADWNSRYPHCQVQDGDHILEVNGVVGAATDLMDRCKADPVLRMKCRRGEFMPVP
eukprot:TRINITY_DN107_c1_g1_i1.p1 TRINITY_DN107_c1_g1~~TRINITY_DN107_c1_g1_i1.p1  ORF type:complete len:187 (+),score=50.10 TRINITY_DN107_c1_g1_i1:152-712(+)